MKKIILIASAIVSIMITGCTENSRVKNFGGTGEITLPKGEKLVNVTCKNDELWYITRPMSSTDSAMTYTFQEHSGFGIVEGTYIITETK